MTVLSLGLGVGPGSRMMGSPMALPTFGQEGLRPEVMSRHRLFSTAGLGCPQVPRQEGVEFGLFPEGDGEVKDPGLAECHLYHWLVGLQRNQSKCCWEAEARSGGSGGLLPTIVSPAPCVCEAGRCLDKERLSLLH